MGAEVGARILLVEDDPTISDLLAYYHQTRRL
jgi:DNA-binding response OmpR family regulator